MLVKHEAGRRLSNARLDPTEGSEQAGNRPIIVSRDAINASSRIILAVPCTIYRPQERIYPSQVLIQAPEGGLADFVAIGGASSRFS